MLKAVIAGYLAAEARRTADRSVGQLSSISNFFFSIQRADETDSDAKVYLCFFMPWPQQCHIQIHCLSHWDVESNAASSGKLAPLDANALLLMWSPKL